MINELTQENTKQQLLINQLQQAATNDPVSLRNKRRRTTSDQSNQYFSGSEDNDTETWATAINQRFDRIEKQQQSMNTALQQIYHAIASVNNNNFRSINFQVPQQQRGRSTSRKSNVSARVQSTIRPMKQSYASALASSKTKPELIRNINIIGDNDKITEVRSSLLTNTAITNFGIPGVKKRGRTILLCSSPTKTTRKRRRRI